MKVDCLDCVRTVDMHQHGRCPYCGSNAIAPSVGTTWQWNVGLQTTAVKTQHDFKGDHLCDSCWNGHHRCTFGECDCLCTKATTTRKVKRGRAAQTVIDTGDDVITIGTPAHKDQG